MTYETLRALAQGAPVGTYLYCWDDDGEPTEHDVREATSRALGMRGLRLATDDHGIYIANSR